MRLGGLNYSVQFKVVEGVNKDACMHHVGEQSRVVRKKQSRGQGTREDRREESMLVKVLLELTKNRV
jgi:hypothetical protein